MKQHNIHKFVHRKFADKMKDFKLDHQNVDDLTCYVFITASILEGEKATRREQHLLTADLVYIKCK
jgi:hypothetical protein